MNAPFSLSGKTALVTGAASGIGLAIAERFIASGARVWLADRDAKAGAAAAAQLGAAAQFVALDVTDPAAAQRLTETVPSLDILVNNAGIGHVGNLTKTASTDLDALYAVNVRGAFNLCKAFVPAMLERGQGSVINLGSIGGIVAVRDRLAYTVSKHAIVGLTRSLALDHSHTGVRFNAICPGRVETPFAQARIAESADPAAARKAMASTQLTGRMAEPVEIANAALYLASDEAQMVTGSCFMIDGGWSAGK